MKEYKVHFSFYDQEFGNFESSAVHVRAQNQFEAQRLAWDKIEENNNFKFATHIKQMGVTWATNPLDLQDYLNQKASRIKVAIGELENVTMLNDKLERNENVEARRLGDKYSLVGSLQMIDEIAEDIAKGYHLEKPSIHEELHYAWKISEHLYNVGNYQAAGHLEKIIERAENHGESFPLSNIMEKKVAFLR